MAKLFKNWKNNKALLFLGFLFLILFLFWPLPASAIWQHLVNAVLTIPYLLITRFLIIITVISWVFVWLTGAILDMVISPAFISLSYTDPARNQIIASGLNITQSFVNLLLVAALVYTALAIALRINETEAKKTLVRLIIVALLVNFTPVLCGLVVDAANIAMNYFLKPIQEGVSGVLTQISTSVGRVIAAILPLVDLSQRLGLVMMIVTQITMNFAIGLAFLFFAVIFLIRYIAIWILVILAPLAFVCWVLPQTKSLWDIWLKNFVQWSIIGIPIAFFLYLAMSSFSILNRVFKGEIEMPGMEATAVGYLNEAFPFLVVIVFLLLGFTIGLSTSAMGSSAVINLTRKVGVWGAKTAGKAGLADGKWAGRRLAQSRLGRRVTSGLQAMARQRTPGISLTQVRGIRDLPRLGLRVIASPIWSTARLIGRAGPALYEYNRRKSTEAEKEVENESVDTTVAKYNRTTDENKRTGYLNRLAKQGDLDEAFEKGLSREDAVTTLNYARDHDMHQEIFAAIPHLDIGRIQRIAQQQGKSVLNVYVEELSKIKPSRAGNISTEAWSDPIIIEATLKAMDGRHMANIFEKQGQKAMNTIENAIRTKLMKMRNLDPNNPDDVDIFFTDPKIGMNNQRLNTWRKTSPGARGLFTLP